MSKYSAIAPVINTIANPATTAFTDNAYNSIKQIDPLGFEWETLQLKKKGEAIADPMKYYTDRNTAIENAKNYIYQQWVVNLKKLLDEHIPEKEARRSADTLAKGLWKAKMAEIDLEYPLTITESATKVSKKIMDETLKASQDPYSFIGGLKLPGNPLNDEKKNKKNKKDKK